MRVRSQAGSLVPRALHPVGGVVTLPSQWRPYVRMWPRSRPLLRQHEEERHSWSSVGIVPARSLNPPTQNLQDVPELTRPTVSMKPAILDLASHPVIPRSLLRKRRWRGECADVRLNRPARVIKRVNAHAPAVLPFAIALRAVPILQPRQSISSHLAAILHLRHPVQGIATAAGCSYVPPPYCTIASTERRLRAVGRGRVTVVRGLGRDPDSSVA
jgi:hypothetical protein